MGQWQLTFIDAVAKETIWDDQFSVQLYQINDANEQHSDPDGRRPAAVRELLLRTAVSPKIFPISRF